MTATNTLLQQGIAAAQAGDRAGARRLLMRLVEADRRNEQGWLWLAGMLDDPDEARTCLERVLALNPASAQARQGLEWIDRRYSSRTASSSARPADSRQPSPAGQPAPVTDRQRPAAAEVAQPAAEVVRPAAAPQPAAQAAEAAAAPAATPAQASDQSDPKSLFSLPTAAAVAAVAPKATGRSSQRAEKARQQAAERAEAKRLKQQAAAEHAEKARQQAAERAEAKHLKQQAAAEHAEKARQQAAARRAEAERLKQEAAAKRAEAAHYALRAVAERSGPDITDEATACPYCGEMNELKRTWCKRCEHSLMIRGAARETRSPWLSALGIFWIIGGALNILAVLGVLVLTLIGYFTLLSAMHELNPKASVPFPLGVIAGVILGGLLAFGQIAVARAMMDRQRWAYYIVAAVTLLNLAGAAIGAFAGAALIRGVLAELDTRALPPEAGPALAALTAAMGAALLVGVGVHGFFTLLVGLSWRDLFGPMERFVPEVKGIDDEECFNFGLACKSRKMWFMAVRQWEAAVKKAPRDAEYLHALGLAYAQLRWLDKSHEALSQAAAADPKSESIRQSLIRIERIVATAH